MMASPLSVSTFRNAFDNRPFARTLSLDTLLRVLTFFREVGPVEDKRYLPAWSPARFRIGEVRKAENVEEVSCLVLDHDDGTEPEVACAPWVRWLHAVHSSWSHTEEAPRFRVVLPLERPVSASRWTTCWRWAAERAGRHNDRSCVDASRLYFLPCLRDNDMPHFSFVHDGPLLDLLAEAPPPPAPRRRWIPPCAPSALNTADRERAAMILGARIRGEGPSRRAEAVPCPRCGRPSVWFWIEPDRLRAACCNHLGTCGWRGSLNDLTGGVR